MEERVKIYLEIVKVATPLLLSMWGGAWFLVKQLIFKPLSELNQRVAELQKAMVAVETHFNTRLVVVEQKMLVFEDRLKYHEDFQGRNQ